MRYVFIAATLALTAFGQIVLKARAAEFAARGMAESRMAYLLAMFLDFGVIAGLAAAVLASVCWMLAIQQTPVSIAYPFMALSFVTVPFLAVYLLGETVSIGQWAGMALIVTGVSLAAIAK